LALTGSADGTAKLLNLHTGNVGSLCESVMLYRHKLTEKFRSLLP
jgi:hypothetical protein